MSATTGNDILSGNGSDNFIDLLAGSDSYAGLGGNDTILGNDGADTIDGGTGNDSILGGDGDDTIIGSAGDDQLLGDAGNDLYLMVGADGASIINDLSGNDTVSALGATNEVIPESDLTDIAGIEAIDLAGGGNTLHLTAARIGAIAEPNLLRVFGVSDNDSLTFDDTGWIRIGSSGGFDTLANAAGNATVISTKELASVDISSVVSGGDGNDTIGTGIGDDTIDGGNGADLIAAFAGNDSVLGGDGHDSIDGVDGADTILGGIGNDRIQGGSGSDSLLGGEGADTLDGGSGADTLLADAGTDSLAGGADGDLYIAGATGLALRIGDSGGNDTLSYVGAAAGDIASASLGSVSGIEAINLGGVGHRLTLDLARVLALSTTTDELRVIGSGSDGLVLSGTGWLRGVTVGGVVTFTNGAVSVRADESLALNLATDSNDVLDGGAGNDLIDALGGDDLVRGLGGNDTLIGGLGNDTLDGGGGADSMLGGAGNDTYVVDDAGDLVRDAAVSGGTDTVLLRIGSFSLANTYAENITGDADLAFLMLGSGRDNVLIGAGQADTLNGSTGNDTLNGGAGNDSLIGGSGGDEFIFDSALGTTNVDRISSYSVTDDAIRLDDAVFVGIGAAGTLAASAFTTGAVATSTDHRIIYNSATGALFYDADGSGTGAAVQFATLTGVSGVITNTEFLII